MVRMVMVAGSVKGARRQGQGIAVSVVPTAGGSSAWHSLTSCSGLLTHGDLASVSTNMSE